MKRNHKKGFTIVELVIVIAVIAILAGVLIPTFAGIVAKANKSAVEQETRAALTVILAEENGQLDKNAKYYFLYKTKDGVEYFQVVDGEIKSVEKTAVDGIDALNNNDVVWHAKGNDTIVEAVGLVTAKMDPANNKELEDLVNVVAYKCVTGGEDYTAPAASEPTT